MPPLNEGDILYMPTTFPNISIEEAKRYLQIQDRDHPRASPRSSACSARPGAPRPRPIRRRSRWSRPSSSCKPRERVAHGDRRALVLGAGRRDGSTPAFRPLLAGPAPDHLGRAGRRDQPRDAAARLDQRVDDADQDAHRHALDRHPHADRHQGLRRRASTTIERIGDRSRARAAPRSRTRAASTRTATRAGSTWTSCRIARRSPATGSPSGEVQDVIEAAVGGQPIEVTVEGRNRFTINVRYPSEMRQDLERLRHVLVPLPCSGAATPGGMERPSRRGHRRCCSPPRAFPMPAMRTWLSRWAAPWSRIDRSRRPSDESPWTRDSPRGPRRRCRRERGRQRGSKPADHTCRSGRSRTSGSSNGPPMIRDEGGIAGGLRLRRHGRGDAATSAVTSTTPSERWHASMRAPGRLLPQVDRTVRAARADAGADAGARAAHAACSCWCSST